MSVPGRCTLLNILTTKTFDMEIFLGNVIPCLLFVKCLWTIDVFIKHLHRCLVFSNCLHIFSICLNAPFSLKLTKYPRNFKRRYVKTQRICFQMLHIKVMQSTLHLCFRITLINLRIFFVQVTYLVKIYRSMQIYLFIQLGNVKTKLAKN